MSEWKPIETAPKDGTAILLSLSDGNMVVAEFVTVSDGSSGWEMFHEELGDCRRGYFCSVTATSWMPLPEPPK